MATSRSRRPFEGLTEKYHALSSRTRTILNAGVVVVVLAILGVIATTQIFGTDGLNGKVGVGNFVWLDSNRNGRVDGDEADKGINGVKVSVYAASADTDSNGELSAAELTAATPIESTVTANDNRAGFPSKPGYYKFLDLDPGDFFVAIPGSNFAVGQPLQALKDVPVPTGVADTQDDNANHGNIPAGGTLEADGVVSTRISLQPNVEPSLYTTKKDDDINHDTDMTIDFGFWHSYAIGNRVWLDKDNSGTINAADGATPGVANVAVRLMDSTGANQIATMTTDTNGYYLFKDLSAGSYIVEIAAINFSGVGVLKDYPVSSAGSGEEADPNMGGDNNDNGINPTAAALPVRSGVITLGPGASEPAGETDLGADGQGDDDAFADMTIDFGFLGTASWGDTVYYDINSNATQDTSEPGIPNVTVTLTCAGADGDLATAADNIVKTQKTDADGKYMFSGLLPGPCKSDVMTTDVPGATLTTPGTFTHTIADQISFLDADYGFIGNGNIGNQVFMDVNTNGRFDTGDVGLEGVTLDLHLDNNANGQIDAGEPIVKTATTNAAGQYDFAQLIVGLSGTSYVVSVTDTGHKLDAFLHVPGNGAADNESKTPAGFGLTLTSAAPQRLEADFGYKPNPTLVIPPKFWKQQAVDGTTLLYTLTWINLSTINGITTSFNDVIPVGTGYISDSLQCVAKGTSQTKSCSFNAQQNRIEWQGTVGADAGHATPDVAVNSIVVTFKVQLADATLEVRNQGFGSYSPISDKTVPSDWIDTQVLDDPTLYTRTKTDATIQKVTGGRLANTGQLVVFSLVAAGILMISGLGITLWLRHKQSKDIII
jgi:uncharacterized repeat protein (TIGR01451 family)